MPDPSKAAMDAITELSRVIVVRATEADGTSFVRGLGDVAALADLAQIIQKTIDAEHEPMAEIKAICERGTLVSNASGNYFGEYLPMVQVRAILRLIESVEDDPDA